MLTVTADKGEGPEQWGARYRSRDDLGEELFVGAGQLAILRL